MDLDVDEAFALPEVKEMVEGITDAVASLGGDRWQATAREIERISKPIARMIARNVPLKNFLKRFSAPAVLVGAVGAYVMARKLGAVLPPRRSAAETSTTTATPATSPTPASSVAQPATDAPQTTDDIQRAARQAEDLVLTLQRKTLALG